MNPKYAGISLYTDATPEKQAVIDTITQFNELANKQVYIITKPLIGEYSYEYNNAIIVLVPDYYVTFIDCSNNTESFNLFVEDFIEDLGYLSVQYQYKSIIGRPKEWRRLITKFSNKEEYLPRKIDDDHDKYTTNLLISLLIGSVKDINNIDINIDNFNQVTLFNTYCLDCLYSNSQKRENEFYYKHEANNPDLLLYKLMILIKNVPDNKISVLCEDQDAAKSLHNKIISFFNLMKVNRQVEWGKHITLMTTWSTWADKYDGMFQYIQRNYQISPYIVYDLEINKKGYPTPESFIKVCGDVYNELGNQKVQKTFDYLFINGDFPQSLIKLCLLTTKSHIFII